MLKESTTLSLVGKQANKEDDRQTDRMLSIVFDNTLLLLLHHHK